MPSEVIAYADKANERVRRKYYRLINKGKPRNIAGYRDSKGNGLFHMGTDDR